MHKIFSLDISYIVGANIIFDISMYLTEKNCKNQNPIYKATPSTMKKENQNFLKIKVIKNKIMQQIKILVSFFNLFLKFILR
jgi:hypothetical protein